MYLRLRVTTVCLIGFCVMWLSNATAGETGFERLQKWREKKNQGSVQPQKHSDDINVIKDISYVSGSVNPKQMLDIYAPKDAKNAPVLMFIHGGAWVIGSKDYETSAAHGWFFASQGIVTVIINYRLGGEAKHPAQIMDCAAAASWVKQNIHKYGGDASRLVLTGHSAGAHLTALLGTNPKFLKAYGLTPEIFSAVAPVDTASFDLTVPATGKGADLVNKCKLKTFGANPDTLKEASPTIQVTEDTATRRPPFILFVTSNRQNAVVETQKLHQALEKVGTKSEINIIPNKSHKQMNLGISTPGSEICKKLLAALEWK